MASCDFYCITKTNRNQHIFRDFFNKNELSFHFVIVYNRNWDNKESIEEIGDD